MRRDTRASKVTAAGSQPQISLELRISKTIPFHRPSIYKQTIGKLRLITCHYPASDDANWRSDCKELLRCRGKSPFGGFQPIFERWPHPAMLACAVNDPTTGSVANSKSPYVAATSRTFKSQSIDESMTAIVSAFSTKNQHGCPIQGSAAGAPLARPGDLYETL